MCSLVATTRRIAPSIARKQYPPPSDTRTQAYGPCAEIASLQKEIDTIFRAWHRTGELLNLGKNPKTWENMVTLAEKLYDPVFAVRHLPSTLCDSSSLVAAMFASLATVIEEKLTVLSDETLWNVTMLLPSAEAPAPPHFAVPPVMTRGKAGKFALVNSAISFDYGEFLCYCIFGWDKNPTGGRNAEYFALQSVAQFVRAEAYDAALSDHMDEEEEEDVLSVTRNAIRNTVDRIRTFLKQDLAKVLLKRDVPAGKPGEYECLKANLFLSRLTEECHVLRNTAIPRTLFSTRISLSETPRETMAQVQTYSSLEKVPASVLLKTTAASVAVLWDGSAAKVIGVLRGNAATVSDALKPLDVLDQECSASATISSLAFIFSVAASIVVLVVAVPGNWKILLVVGLAVLVLTLLVFFAGGRTLDERTYSAEPFSRSRWPASFWLSRFHKSSRLRNRRRDI